MSIIIDPEFRALIPPLTANEYKQLEKNILEESIRDALIVWPQPDGNDILVDGHNRFQIAAAHAGIRFNIKKMDFDSREDAKRWIILNQFGRRNLSAYDRSVLALKLKPMIAEQAKERQAQAGRGEEVQKSAQAKTRDELARAAGVSHDTIHKVEAIEKGATDKTKQLVREGKLSINQAYNSVHPKRIDPVKQAKEEHEAFEAKKQNGIVDFQDAQADKDNQQIIKTAFLQDVLKLLNDIDRFGMTYKQADLAGLADQIDEDEKKIILSRCDVCRGVLLKIQTSLM